MVLEPFVRVQRHRQRSLSVTNRLIDSPRVVCRNSENVPCHMYNIIIIVIAFVITIMIAIIVIAVLGGRVAQRPG